ncbi:MAG: DUF1565 domain-containing protein, partial [Proteobacteria bacterium]|nr:DUF1565 domain-containing protein [Pseudomonadota bacterium]
MKRFLLLLSCFLVLALVGHSWAADWYVRTDGSDLNDGKSWGLAFATIRKAVSVANDGEEIWVAAGTYIPSYSIFLNSAVSLYGGFAGTETLREQRDWVNHVTTVDGDNGFVPFQVYADATIDGFTIQNGYYGFGGGMRINSSAPTISNCTFSLNNGYIRGGAIYNYNSTPTISNCTFNENTSNLVGGAIYNFHSAATITNSKFYKNSAGRHGGAIYNDTSDALITNSTFHENRAGSDGGAINNFSASPMITNCTFYKNTAISYGRAID